MALASFKQWLVGVVESTYNWYRLVDGLMQAGYLVHLAHPAGWDSDCCVFGLHDENRRAVRALDDLSLLTRRRLMGDPEAELRERVIALASFALHPTSAAGSPDVRY